MSQVVPGVGLSMYCQQAHTQTHTQMASHINQHRQKTQYSTNSTDGLTLLFSPADQDERPLVENTYTYKHVDPFSNSACK